MCGKTTEVSNIQDLLLFVTRGIAVYKDKLRKSGKVSDVADQFILDAMFMSVTNASFDFEAINEKVKEGLRLKTELAALPDFSSVRLPDECTWNGDESTFMDKATEVGVLRTTDEDVRSLKELVHYGLKGMAAYAAHAYHLCSSDEGISGLYKKLCQNLHGKIFQKINSFRWYWKRVNMGLMPVLFYK